jgi:chitinase
MTERFYYAQVSFAVGHEDGALSFSPAIQSVVQFKSDIQAVKAQGRRVFISKRWSGCAYCRDAQ